MLSRLTELTVSGFRAFSEGVTIPLDAEVVLLYGPNAAGKTSVLSAIEYGITGSVAELVGFAGDYPRCLVNGTSASVHLSGRQTDGATIESVLGLPEASTVPPSQPWHSIARFFRDRCYLSQRQLGRLLELYQEPQSSTRAQPLSEFVQELLQLDSVRRLQDGLHVAMDIRRVRQRSSSMLMLENERDAVRAREAAARNRAKELRATLADRIAELEISLKAGNIHESVSHEKLGEDLTRHFLSARSDLAAHDDRLEQLRQFASELEILREFERRDLPTLRADEVESKLIEAQRRLAEVNGHLANFGVSLRRVLELPASDQDLDIERLIARAENYSRSAQERINVYDEALSRRQSLQVEFGKIEAQLKQLSNVQTGTDDRRLAYLLAEVLPLVETNLCPVCGRDYGELATGSLESHLRESIQRLGERVEQLEMRARREANLREQLRQTEERLSAVVRQLTNEETTVTGLRMFLRDVAGLMDEAKKLGHHRLASREFLEIIRQHEREIRELRSREERLLRVRARVASMAAAVGIDLEAGHPIDELIGRFRQQLDNLLSQERVTVDGIRARIGFLERCGDALEGVTKSRFDLAEAENLAKTNLATLASIEAKLQKVNSAILHAKDVVRAAGEVQKIQLDRVINAQLNRLWRDVFLRLVPGETFYPQLDEVVLQRGHRAEVRFRVNSHARAGVFEQPGSVLSAGNLNTAALSLFLGLFLVERSLVPLLVLDDPVQSMDDIRVGELALLLRRLLHQRELQLIIAVHERTLFDYLCLELGPSRPGASLIAIELQRDSRTRAVTVLANRVSWKDTPDSVRFGENPKS